VCILCFCFSYCIYVVLLSAQWGGSNGIEAQSLRPLFLQCFDTVGLVFWPIKPVPDMSYKCVWWDVKSCSIQFNSNVRAYWCVHLNRFTRGSTHCGRWSTDNVISSIEEMYIHHMRLICNAPHLVWMKLKIILSQPVSHAMHFLVFYASVLCWNADFSTLTLIFLTNSATVFIVRH